MSDRTGILLTERKREILDLAAQGKTDKQIALELKITLNTVQSHWKSIRASLEVSSRSEAIARVVSQDIKVELAGLEADRQALFEQLHDTSSQTKSLEDKIRDLEAIVERQAEFLTKLVASSDRKVAQLMGRLDRLEKLNTLVTDQKVLIHCGEYGASWRKHYMSDSIRFTDTEPEHWERGEVNFFDYVDSRYIERNVQMFKPFEKGVHRLCLTFAAKSPTGPRFFFEFLTCEIIDDSGVGTYKGISVDVTEWGDEIERIIREGWLKPISGTV